MDTFYFVSKWTTFFSHKILPRVLRETTHHHQRTSVVGKMSLLLGLVTG